MFPFIRHSKKGKCRGRRYLSSCYRLRDERDLKKSEGISEGNETFIHFDRNDSRVTVQLIKTHKTL